MSNSEILITNPIHPNVQFNVNFMFPYKTITYGVTTPYTIYSVYSSKYQIIVSNSVEYMFSYCNTVSLSNYVCNNSL